MFISWPLARDRQAKQTQREAKRICTCCLHAVHEYFGRIWNRSVCGPRALAIAFELTFRYVVLHWYSVQYTVLHREKIAAMLGWWMICECRSSQAGEERVGLPFHYSLQTLLLSTWMTVQFDIFISFASSWRHTGDESGRRMLTFGAIATSCRLDLRIKISDYAHAVGGLLFGANWLHLLCATRS